MKAGEIKVVEKTPMEVGRSFYWLWLAIEPERRKILLMALSQTRNALIARSVFKELRRRYGRVKIVSDLAKWYPGAAETLELEHEILSGGIRITPPPTHLNRINHNR